MANEQNLKPVRTKSEARERGANGGRKSGESKRNKKMLKECLELLLERKNKVELDGSIARLTGAELIALTAYNKALSGDVKAMEFVRDTAGQKPVEKVMYADVDPDVIAEVEAMVKACNDAQ